MKTVYSFRYSVSPTHVKRLYMSLLHVLNSGEFEPKSPPTHCCAVLTMSCDPMMAYSHDGSN